jgi:hypothetical protein
MEEEPPVSAWGTEFFTLPFATRTAGDEYTIVASQANTTVTRNGAVLVGLPADGANTVLLTSASHITANAPILLEHLATGGEFKSDGNGDPTLIDVPPVSYYTRLQTVAVPATGFANSFLNVTIAAADIPTLTLDGVPVQASLFSPVGDSTTESGAQIPVTPGAQTLAAAGPFGVEAYGFDPSSYDAYGFPGAFGDPARAAAPQIAITAPANGATYAAGQQVAVAYACSAALGTTISACAGPVANGSALPTSQAGPQSFTVTATDGYGGKATQTATYTVAAQAQTTTTTQTAPSNLITVDRLKVDTQNGKVTVPVVVPGPGTLRGMETAVSAHLATAARRKNSTRLVVATTHVTVKKKGTVQLIFKPSAKAKRVLKRLHKLATIITIAFTPVHGKAHTVTVHATVRLK